MGKEPVESDIDQLADWIADRHAHFNNTSSITTGVFAVIECFRGRLAGSYFTAQRRDDTKATARNAAAIARMTKTSRAIASRMLSPGM